MVSLSRQTVNEILARLARDALVELGVGSIHPGLPPWARVGSRARRLRPDTEIPWARLDNACKV